MVFGGGLEKCLEDMLLQVYTHADSVMFVQSSHFKSASEQELYEAMIQAGYDIAMPLGCKPIGKVQGGTMPQRMQEILKLRSPRRKEKPVIVVWIIICGS